MLKAGFGPVSRNTGFDVQAAQLNHSTRPAMTRDELLHAVIENPDDDALRLVFADWLEEHSELERAEFIRVQIELAKLLKVDDRRPELERRETELLARNESEWVEPIRHCVLSWTFARGFIAEVAMTVDMYQKHTFELLNLAPIRRMSVDGAEVEISGSARRLVPESIAREALILPLGHGHFFHDECLVVAVPSPIDDDVMQRLNFILNRNIAAVEAPRRGLEEMIDRYYGNR
jgi:uncharacterized protein (TIGR02996 family)